MRIQQLFCALQELHRRALSNVEGQQMYGGFLDRCMVACNVPPNFCCTPVWFLTADD